MLLDLQSLWERNFRLNQSAGTTGNSYLIVGAPSARAFDLTALTTAYTLTGTIVLTKAGRYLSALNNGVYTYTGTVAGTLRGAYINILNGTYAVTGTLAGVRVSHVIPIAGGAYTVAGTTTPLIRGYLVISANGVYLIDGDTIPTTLIFTGGGGPPPLHLLAMMGLGG